MEGDFFTSRVPRFVVWYIHGAGAWVGIIPVYCILFFRFMIFDSWFSIDAWISMSFFRRQISESPCLRDLVVHGQQLLHCSESGSQLFASCYGWWYRISYVTRLESEKVSMFDESFDSYSDEYYTSNYLSTRSDRFRELFSESYTYEWYTKSNNSNPKGGNKDLCGTRCEWYSDCESIDTGCHWECEEGSEWEYIARRVSCIISLKSLVDHISSNIGEEDKCYPVIIVSNNIRKKRCTIKSNNWHHCLKQSKTKCQTDCLFHLDMFLWYSGTDSNSKCICWEWECKEEYGNTGHSIRVWNQFFRECVLPFLFQDEECQEWYYS